MQKNRSHIIEVQFTHWECGYSFLFPFNSSSYNTYWSKTNLLVIAFSRYKFWNIALYIVSNIVLVNLMHSIYILQVDIIYISIKGHQILRLVWKVLSPFMQYDSWCNICVVYMQIYGFTHYLNFHPLSNAILVIITFFTVYIS